METNTAHVDTMNAKDLGNMVDVNLGHLLGLNPAVAINRIMDACRARHDCLPEPGHILYVSETRDEISGIWTTIRLVNSICGWRGEIEIGNTLHHVRAQNDRAIGTSGRQDTNAKD